MFFSTKYFRFPHPGRRGGVRCERAESELGTQGHAVGPSDQIPRPGCRAGLRRGGETAWGLAAPRASATPGSAAAPPAARGQDPARAKPSRLVPRVVPGALAAVKREKRVLGRALDSLALALSRVASGSWGQEL